MHTQNPQSEMVRKSVQHVQLTINACVDKYTLRNSEGDPVAYEG